MIVIADLHLKEESFDVVLHEVLPGIFQACLERSEHEVAILGDVLHFRYKVDARIQNALKDEVERWGGAGIHIRILPGNHDQYDISGRNALELFDAIPNVKVYSKPTWDKDGLWIPYCKDPKAIASALRTLAPGIPETANTLFLHHGVRGAWMNDNVQDSEGVELESLDPLRWKAILCGHYHKHQKIGQNFWYVGSPWQTTANEAGQVKGFVEYSNQALAFVPKTWGPRFHRFELAPGQALDLSQVNPRDEVRVKTMGAGAEAAAAIIGKQLVTIGLARHVVTPEVEPMQARLSVPMGATLANYATAYVQQIGTDLNHGRLMQMYGELTA